MKPVSVTSPTHAVALASVVGQGALALQLINGTATTKALDQAIGHGATWIIPVAMIVGAAGALTSALTMRRLTDPSDALRLEGMSWAVLAIVTLAYAWSLTNTYGWLGGATTQTYAWSLGVGYTGRVWQIIHDLRRFKRAAQIGSVADPAPLGEPDQTGG